MYIEPQYAYTRGYIHFGVAFAFTSRFVSVEAKVRIAASNASEAMRRDSDHAVSQSGNK